MKKIIYLIMASFLSCQSIDKPAKPEVFIEEDRMIEILTDIAVVKAAKSTSRRVLEEKDINPEAYILKKHGIDSVVFAKNHAWYADQLEEYEKIFAKVKNNLEKEKVRYEKQKKEEDSIKKVEDSIKKIKENVSEKDKIDTTETDEDEKIAKDIEKAKQKRLRSGSKND